MSELPRILIVDDEPAVLTGLRRNLHGKYAVTTCELPVQGLEMLGDDPGYDVIMSDMRMPVMNGAEFLSNARRVAPDAVRVLLTGESDLDMAAAAVNDGAIFRFLRKPCPTPDLLAALSAAVVHHRILRAERDVLESTLNGSVRALTEVLSIANPLAFARTQRIQRTVEWAVGALQLSDGWTIEVAASLVFVGAVTLPDALSEKLDRGLELTPAESKTVASLGKVADHLLEGIPRLGPVREIILHHEVPPTAAEAEAAPEGAKLLRIAIALDKLEARGVARRRALHRLHEDGLLDRSMILGMLEALGASDETPATPYGVTIDDLDERMVFAADVVDDRGMLLVGRGQQVSAALIGRLRNYQRTLGPILVVDADRERQPV
jgi:response regulator RpfG family c-di-GMP phosphodiesterase